MLNERVSSNGVLPNHSSLVFFTSSGTLEITRQNMRAPCGAESKYQRTMVLSSDVCPGFSRDTLFLDSPTGIVGSELS